MNELYSAIAAGLLFIAALLTAYFKGKKKGDERAEKAEAILETEKEQADNVRVIKKESKKAVIEADKQIDEEVADDGTTSILGDDINKLD